MRRPFIIALLLSLLAVAPALAATPRDELLRLVPDRVGFCLTMSDLRGQTAAFRQSAFFQQLRNSRLGESLLGGPEVAKLFEVERHVKGYLGVDFSQLRDDILGDALVVAYQPGPPDRPDQEQGLLLIRAGNAALLTQLIDRLNMLEKQSGDLKELEPRRHNDQPYFRRVKAAGGDQFYYRSGPVLVLASQEGVLREAIDLDRQAPATDTTPPPVARQLRQLGADKGLISWWLNPRAFDAALVKKAEAARGAEAAFLQNFLVYWKALDGLAFYGGLVGDDLELSLAAHANPLQFPPAALRLFVQAAQPATLWSDIPDDALLAAAIRLDFGALRDVIGEFLTEDARKATRAALDRGGRATLGRDLATEVLPLLGPDLGISITAPPADDPAWFPRVTAALKVQPGDKSPPLDQALFNSLSSFVVIGVLDYNFKNAQAVTLKSANENGVEVKYLVNEERFPPGLQPALGRKDGYLLLASSPDALRQFKPGATPGLPLGEMPLLRISVKGWRTYLQQRKEALVAFVVEREKLDPAEAAQRFDRMLAGLALLDRVEVTQRVGLGTTTWTLRLRPTAEK